MQLPEKDKSQSLHTDKQLVQKLISTLVALGIREAVISPGSRSAPLVQELSTFSVVKKTVIFDERSAAYFALGIAQQTKKPVVLVCTSGTALLNYAPAICEAFYQKIPLLILTADRPAEMIGRGENQTIYQQNIYANFIKASFQLSENMEIFAAFVSALFPMSGPVHINVPLAEPLYETVQNATPLDAVIASIPTTPLLSKQQKIELASRWATKKSKVIICGKDNPDSFKLSLLKKINQQSDVLIFSEPIANTPLENTIQNVDSFLASLKTSSDLDPDLVVTIGQQVLSKRLRTWIKNIEKTEHWHVSVIGEKWDIFDKLSETLICTDTDFLKVISKATPPLSGFKQKALLAAEKATQFTENFAQQEWSDFFVFSQLSKLLEPNSIVQWGNSSVIRYASLFEYDTSITHFANRGTSGIDGSLSTAVGCAITNPDKKVYAVLGDISFFYDSNALFITPFPKNLKIILINNGGGSIFRMIDGQKEDSLLQTYFEARHTHDAAHFASMFGLPYYICEELEKWKETISPFFSLENQAAFLELKTSSEMSTTLFKQYFKTLST